MNVLLTPVWNHRACVPHLVVTNEPVIRIGRDGDCHLRSSSPAVDLCHCELRFEQDAVTIRDCDSTNGTFVNGERIFGEATLSDGDILHIADEIYEVCIHGPEEADAPGPSVGSLAAR